MYFFLGILTTTYKKLAFTVLDLILNIDKISLTPTLNFVNIIYFQIFISHPNVMVRSNGDTKLIPI